MVEDGYSNTRERLIFFIQNLATQHGAPVCLDGIRTHSRLDGIFAGIKKCRSRTDSGYNG